MIFTGLIPRNAFGHPHIALGLHPSHCFVHPRIARVYMGLNPRNAFGHPRIALGLHPSHDFDGFSPQKCFDGFSSQPCFRHLQNIFAPIQTISCSLTKGTNRKEIFVCLSHRRTYFGSILNQRCPTTFGKRTNIQLSFHHVFVVGQAQVTFRHCLGRFTFGLEII